MNINEIAKLAGVSRATVSRYLNQGYVSEEKKRQIQKVIDETGYQPSAQAQQLRSGRTKTIGVILPKINSDSVSRMVAGISLVLSQSGYQLLMGDTHNQEKEEIQYLKLFHSNKVDGIILVGTVLTKQHYETMAEMEVPIVVLGQQAEKYSCVYHDDYHAAKELTEHLLKDAHRVGYIGVTLRDKAAGEARMQGFTDAVTECAHPVQYETEKDMRESEFTMESGYHQMGELLRQDPQIDSVFCATDSIAVGAMMYLREQGIKIPKQIQLVGVGDTMMGRVAAVSLSTVHFFYKTSGMEAATMLLSILDSGKNIRREVKMGYKVLDHDSTR